MAESTSPFLDSTAAYILKTGALADQFASRFGISKYAIIGVVANEYDARYAYSVLDSRGSYLQGLTDQLVSFAT